MASKELSLSTTQTKPSEKPFRLQSYIDVKALVKGTQPGTLDKDSEFAINVFLNKPKVIKCTCNDLREMLLASRDPGKNSAEYVDFKKLRDSYYTKRDECLAHHPPFEPQISQRERCAEAWANWIRLNTIDQDRTYFPTQAQIDEAQLDSLYERSRCPLCKTRKNCEHFCFERCNQNVRLKYKWRVENGELCRVATLVHVPN